MNYLPSVIAVTLSCCKRLADLLASDELLLLKTLHPDFYADGVSAIPDDKLLHGRPFGGIAFLWRKALQGEISVKKFECDARIMGLELRLREHAPQALDLAMNFGICVRRTVLCSLMQPSWTPTASHSSVTLTLPLHGLTTVSLHSVPTTPFKRPPLTIALHPLITFLFPYL